MSRTWVPAHEVEPDHLAEIWNFCLPDRFRVDGELIGRLGTGHPCYDRDMSWAIMEAGNCVGFVEGKSSAARLYDGPNPKVGHVHSWAFMSPDVGTELIDRVVEVCQGRFERLVFGQDNGHFWPGVAEDWETGRQVLEQAGFEPVGGWSNDLECDLRWFEPDFKALEALGKPGVAARRAEKEDAAAMDEFFQREFPGRWRYDVESAFVRQASDVFLLFVDQTVEGFALTQSEESGSVPFAGCVWKEDLGESWGGLGPIGVSTRVRGTGLGGGVLVRALSGLKQAGVRRCLIDWTGLTEFYGKYGFEVTRRYQGMTRILG